MPRAVKHIQEKSIPARIIDLLAKGDKWHSGEDLAELFGISRAAVGKHVAALRKAGHVIAASTNKGYALLVKHEPIESEIVRSRLRTRTVGRSGWRTLTEAESTNNEAITWALAGAPTGSVVTAEKQTHGKGRIGREWFSSVHGLHFSIILRPRATDESTVVKYMLSAVAAAVETLADVKPSIKEPNDLLVNGKKIAGVLSESGRRGSELEWLVIGVGCNVNVLADEFPAAIKSKATSLYEISGHAIAKNSLLAEILNRFETAAGRAITGLLQTGD